MYRWLKFGRKLLRFALQEQHRPAAKVCLPNEEETQQYFNAAISVKYPAVLAPPRVWGACNSLKLHLQQPGNWTKQNQYYNGYCWTCGTYVNSVSIFAPDGRIRPCILNAPGCWQDTGAQADYGFYYYEKMELMYYERFLLVAKKVVVDPAFKLSKKPYYYLMRSSQSDPFNAAALLLQ
eukprot:jgi/Psemu1/56517/gm1.56517_g